MTTPEVGVANIDSGVNALKTALAPIRFVNVVGDRLNQLWDSLAVAAQAGELDRTAEVSTVPSIVKSPVESNVDTPAGPLGEVAKTVRNVRDELRAGLIERRTDGSNKISETAQDAGNGVVRTQGEIRNAVTKAVSDVTNALRPGKPSKAADGATAAPTNVVKSIGDTARNVVKQVREAAKDARDSVKNRPASDADE